MKFCRSLKQGPGITRSHKCPDDVLQKVKSGKQESARYFDLWLGCEQEWGKVTLFEYKIKRQVKGEETITDWFTLDQLIQFYNSQEVGAAVAASRTEEEVK